MQKNLCARLILIDGNNAELEAIVPHPKEEVFEVHQRECDYQFTVSIGRFIGDLLKHDTHRQLLFPDDEGTHLMGQECVSYLNPYFHMVSKGSGAVPFLTRDMGLLPQNEKEQCCIVMLRW